MNNGETTSYVVDILAHAQARPNKLALICGERSLTYGELPSEIAHRAHKMAAEGLGPDTLAAIVTRDPVEDILLRLALSCLGGICCSFDPDMEPELRQERGAHYGVDILLVSEDCVIKNHGTEAIAALHMTADWRAAGQGGIIPLHPAPPRAVVVSSSGTTGIPAMMVFSHQMLRVNADWLKNANIITPETVFLNQMPHFINAGTTLTAVTLAIGATCVVKPDIRNAGEMVEAALTHEATMFLAPPFLLPPLLAIARNRGHRPLFPRLDALWIVGDSGSPELIEEAAEWLTPGVCSSYGSSSTGLISLLTAADFEAGRGSAGRAFENVLIEIVDRDDRPVSVGQPGRIRVMTPTSVEATLGPLRDNGEETRDGYVYTGDVGHLDESGFLYILGRSADVIVREGASLYPLQIETALKACPGVREIAVAGVPWNNNEKAPVAFVVAQAEVTMAVLRNFAEKHLDKIHLPVDYVFRDVLPRNHLGKVVKRQLVAEYAAD